MFGRQIGIPKPEERRIPAAGARLGAVLKTDPHLIFGKSSRKNRLFGDFCVKIF